ncbi:hypothetical protein [Dactylosporangium sp. NPDC050588]|uniref:hypothetical protein n=1 Tax=Dactylosporangium sp. NPDC050588 TaxID=3157211 RepID=UPI0033FE12AD
MDERSDAAAPERPDGEPLKGASESWLAEAGSVVVAAAESMWRQARDREHRDWPPTWLKLFIVLAATVVLAIVVVPLMRGIGIGVAKLTGWGREQALARVVLDPVNRYLNEHAAALPVDADTLWWTWWLTGGVLVLFSAFRSLGARIGWVLYGAAGTAMITAGTATSGRWIAGGVGGLCWCLLSIPVLRRPPTAPAITVVGPAPAATGPAADRPNGPPTRAADAATNGPADSPPDDDDVAWAAQMYEVLLRRERLATRSTQRWTATTHGANGFTAVADDGRRAAGIAISTEAVHEMLAGLSDPPGQRPRIDWTTTPPAAPHTRRVNYDDLQTPDAIHDFVRRNRNVLAQLIDVLQERRETWPTEKSELRTRIDERATALNLGCPLASAASSFMPEPAGPDTFGTIALNDWVPIDTIIAGGGAASWNDFATHRPRIVGMIIQKLLTADDPQQALLEILADGGHLYLSRYHGPAGPIHVITINGTHRTHALRLLDVSLIAAEVTVDALPPRIDVFSTSNSDGWGEDRHHGPTEALWRALMDRDLLTGRIVNAGFDAVLEPYRVTAPWLLCSPRDAAATSAAYERLYPGALGIPIEAMGGPAQWCRWLLDDPFPSHR